MDLKEVKLVFLLAVFVVLFCFTYCKNEESAITNKSGEKHRFLCWLPVPMKSHQKFLEPLLRELTSKGHHVTLVTPMPMSSPPANLEQIVIQDQYKILSDIIKNQAWYQQINPAMMLRLIGNFIESIFEDPVVKTFVKEDRKFDAILMESTILNEAFIGLHHKYQALVIELIPLPTYHWSFYLLGIPYDTSYIADAVVSYTDQMTFLQRLHNTAMSLFLRVLGELFILPLSENIMNKHLIYTGWEDRPPIREMISNISLVLINSHFSVSYPHPVPPHVKEIAGINMNPTKPLPKDLLEFIDSATDGVVIFSMGSHISMEKTLGPEKTEIFKTIFSKIKQKVLWKYESELKDLPPNVRITKWFPQTDILAHKNSKLFISHCGYHSSIEAIYNRVPVIAMPVQGDQSKNAKMLTHFGMAYPLSLDNITEETVSWTLNEVLNNKKYIENAIARSNIYRDMKETPMETALYWIEYVIRHKGAHHLKPSIISMPWYQQALIDVYFALAVLSLIPIIIIYCCVKCMLFSCKKLFKKNPNKNKKD